MNCKNCNNILSGKAIFCSNCGQKKIEKLNLKYIISQFIEDIFNVDSKVFLTIKALAFKPGFLSKEYIEGKRVKYVPPVRLYIVLSVVFFFVLSVVNYGDNDGSSRSITIGNSSESDLKTDGVNFSIGDTEIRVPTEELKRMQCEGTLDEGLDSLTINMSEFPAYLTKKLALAKINNEGFMDILSDQFSLFLLLFLPFFSILYSITFSRNKKGFIGHLIFNLHLNSFVMVSLLLYMLIDIVIGGNDLIDIIWFGVVLLFGQYYLIKSIMKFYDRKWWIALYKYLLLILGYIVLAIMFIILVFASSIIMV